jgi:uncharacterized protein YutE (UPF0331/DUF86 family)
MVNRVLAERILGDIKANVRDLRNATDITWDVYRTDKRARRFVERTLHIIIEACIDIAQHMISDEGFREPSGYRDTFTVLAEQGVLRKEDLEKFENIASFRNLIVHYYERVDDAVVYGVFKENLSDFDLFVDRIIEYLEREKKANSRQHLR